MVTTQPTTDVLTRSWQLTPYPMVIDTSSLATYIPKDYYTFVMKEALEASVGFFYDTTLETYVVSCDQQSLLKDIFIKFADSGIVTAGGNLWYKITPSDFMREIETTDICQIMLKQHSENSWIFGLSMLNKYTTDFDYDPMRFSIKNYDDQKPWTSTQEALQLVIVNPSVSKT